MVIYSTAMRWFKAKPMKMAANGCKAASIVATLGLCTLSISAQAEPIKLKLRGIETEIPLPEWNIVATLLKKITLADRDEMARTLTDISSREYAFAKYLDQIANICRAQPKGSCRLEANEEEDYADLINEKLSGLKDSFDKSRNILNSVDEDWTKKHIDTNFMVGNIVHDGVMYFSPDTLQDGYALNDVDAIVALAGALRKEADSLMDLARQL